MQKQNNVRRSKPSNIRLKPSEIDNVRRLYLISDGVGDGGRGSGGRGRRRGGSGVTSAAVELPVDVDRGSGAGWASGRGWRSPGEAWAVLGDDGGSSAMVAAAWARRRRLRMRAGDREK
jgi:hypothetical protein